MEISKLTSISISLLLTCCCLILCCDSQPIAIEDTRSAPQEKFLGVGEGFFGGLIAEVDVSGTWSPSGGKPGKPGKPGKKKPNKRPGHGGGGTSVGHDPEGGLLEDLIGSWILSDLNNNNYGCKRKC